MPSLNEKPLMPPMNMSIGMAAKGRPHWLVPEYLSTAVLDRPPLTTRRCLASSEQRSIRAMPLLATAIVFCDRHGEVLDTAIGCSAELISPGSGSKWQCRSAPPIANIWSYISAGLTAAMIAPFQALVVALIDPTCGEEPAFEKYSSVPCLRS